VTAEESPDAMAGASVDSGESTTPPSLQANRASASKRLRLSDTAESWIANLAHDLATGVTEFWQLPPSLVEFYYVAFFEGRETLTGELTQAQRDADRLYAVAYGPKTAPEPSNYLTFAQLELLRDGIYGGAK
jgi:hypothetical protein